jgi:hypothetical protein
LSFVFPPAALPREINGLAHGFGVWVNSEIMQQLQCGEGRDARLRTVVVIEVPSRKTGASRPLTVWILQAQQFRTPTLKGYAYVLLRDDLSGCLGQIAKYLPTNRRI